ncbi:hypothetical protein, partial [Acinetobacter baumannii]
MTRTANALLTPQAIKVEAVRGTPASYTPLTLTPILLHDLALC